MMAVNLRAPHSERYAIEVDEGPGRGPRLGAALSDWDHEDASRNPSGLAGAFDESNDGWRRWIRGGFGVLALAGFVGVLWYAYEWGLGGGETVELPTVQAEAGPEKEKPSDPGGLQVPYQDQLVLNQERAEGTAPRVERLLPPPEAPLPPPALTGIAPSYDELPEATAPAGAAGAAIGEAGTLQPAGEPPAADTTAAEQSAGAVPDLPAAPSAQAGETRSSQTQTAAAPPSETQSAATQPATAQAPAAGKAAGEFAVQLVSLKDAGAAKKEWRRLQGVFPDLLGDKSLLLQTADVAGVGTVYRLRAGPFATRDKAAKFCAQLKSKQQDCLVVNR